MRRKRNRKRPMEFSKKIFIGVSIVNLLILIFACIMVWKTYDLSPLNYLIPAAAAEMATATGFYYNKAKAENKIKLEELRRTRGLDPYGDDNADIP
jgi:hypothetical protein